MFAVKATAENRKTRMRFHANLGHLPFTSERGGGRKHVVKIVNTAGSMLGGKVRISPEQRIMLGEEYWFDEPLTPNLLLTKTVQLLVAAKPYLVLLSEYINKPVSRRSFGKAKSIN